MFSARWIVASEYDRWPVTGPGSVTIGTGESTTWSRVRSSTSVMTSPTTTVRAASPSSARWAAPTAVGASSRSAA